MRQQLKERDKQLEAWEEWLNLTNQLDERYEVFGCKKCRYFVGSEDGGNFFVCAMHPYGKRCCEDREQKSKKDCHQAGNIRHVLSTFVRLRGETMILNPNVISVYAGTPVEEINAISGLLQELQAMSRDCQIPIHSENREVYLGANRPRVKEIGELPQPPQAVGRYHPWVKTGHLIFVSGQFPLVNGVLKYAGKLGADLNDADGDEAAKLAGLNVLAQLHIATQQFETLDI